MQKLALATVLLFSRLQTFALVAVLVNAVLLFVCCESFGQTPEDQPEGPALAPDQAQQSFTTLDGYKWDLLVSEPNVQQPVFATFDYKGRMWVVQYLQYPEPAGLNAISHDNYWRVVYDRKPEPPINKLEGKDKITVYDLNQPANTKGTDFISGLNIATAVAPDVDGVWVLNPPYLLFYKDRNQDLVPDGPPEVHLDGFGLEDTHSVVNSLCFGPDGWLYAAQGSTVSGAVHRYKRDDKPIKTMGQLIWRYHPETKVYEVFAEGGGNAFGVAFDDAGRIFSGHNGGDTRGFHYEQGGYYRKGFSKHGELSNPFAYGYLMPMVHDPIQRFTHTMLLTSGTQFRSLAPDSMLAVDPLHSTIVQTKLIREGSTFKTEDQGIAVKSTDKWFRPVAITDGPDGAAYVSDWYDSQVAHIYAHEGKLDRDHGRIYKLSTKDDEVEAWDPKLADFPSFETLDYLKIDDLLEKLKHPYRWQRWAARRLIAKNHSRLGLVRYDLEMMIYDNSEYALDALWTLHECGMLEDCIGAGGIFKEKPVEIGPYFEHTNPDIRRWAVRLACDNNKVKDKTLVALIKMANQEMDPEVLVQLAASARRLPAQDALPLTQRLIQRLDLLNDQPFLMMCWWAVEKHAGEYDLVSSNILQLSSWSSRGFRQEIAPRLLRRWLEAKSPKDMAYAAKLLERIANLPSYLIPDASQAAVKAFEEAYAGRSLAGVPDMLLDALAKLGQPSISLQLRRGDGEVVDAAIAKIRDDATPIPQRLQLISVLAEVPNAAAGPQLKNIALEAALSENIRVAAIQSLASYPEVDFVDGLLQQWSTLSSPLKLATIGVMSSRANWTTRLIKELKEKQIDVQDVPLELVRNMRLHNDPAIQEGLNELFPDTKSMDLTTAQTSVKQIVENINKNHGDPYRGKKLYAESCGRCHKLFGGNGEIGPDLTGYQRDMTSVLALNIVAPSLEIREGYQAHAILTTDSEVINGFVVSNTDDEVVLRGTDGQLHVVQRDNIDEMKPQPLSLMPQGLLDKLNEQQVCDLFAYLRSSQPLND